ncbi:MAG: flavodoxin [bacterium]|uniref:Flavodoxin n=1 Tax=Candidatus Aphodosoma intestinipullorum TaxID=2840674 RepID=A0A940DKF2_9BACT|nr:flavodoxin [Candidatus Aphodosoma intestinipullorum]
MRTVKVLLTLMVIFAMNINAQNRQDSRVLVAYFSATGTTAKAAERLAHITGGALYEIRPETAYTSADLDWHDSSSRSSVEMKDPAARPAITGGRVDMALYDTVYIGYPIWWDAAPRVVNTFIESVSLEGKTVIPFATSGGSSINGSVSALRRSYPNIRWQDGRLLNGMSEKAIRAWVEKSADGK